MIQMLWSILELGILLAEAQEEISSRLRILCRLKLLKDLLNWLHFLLKVSTLFKMFKASQEINSKKDERERLLKTSKRRFKIIITIMRYKKIKNNNKLRDRVTLKEGEEMFK
jgi:hypothetical protein